MFIDVTQHQVALQSSNFCPVQPIVIKISMMMNGAEVATLQRHLVPSYIYEHVIFVSSV